MLILGLILFTLILRMVWVVRGAVMLTFLKCMATQYLILSGEEELDYLMMGSTFAKISTTLLISQFIVCLYCKIVFIILHQIFTWISIGSIISHENYILENQVTSALLILTFEIGYYILFKLMDENHLEGLQNTLRVIKL